MLNFLATVSILIPCFFANSNSVTLSKFLSLIGAIIGKLEPERNVMSNLTWSFPLPEHPCASDVTFSFFAISKTFSAINGLASAVARQYFFWYSAFAFIDGKINFSEFKIHV